MKHRIRWENKTFDDMGTLRIAEEFDEQRDNVLLQLLLTQMLLYKPLLLHQRHRDLSVNLQCIPLSEKK